MISDKLVRKHSNKVKRSNLTSFFTQNTPSQDKQRVSMSFEPVITNKLKSKFAEHRLEIVYKNNGKLQNLTKDKMKCIQVRKNNFILEFFFVLSEITVRCIFKQKNQSI